MNNTQSLVERLTENMSLFPNFVYLILLVIFIIGTNIMLVVLVKDKLHPIQGNNDIGKVNIALFKKFINTICTIGCLVLLIIELILFSALITTTHIAYTHGYRQFTEGTTASLWPSISKSPVEDKLPEDETNKLFIAYRFACEDCEAIYTDLELNLGIYDPIWVATRSKQGKNFVEKYGIDEVPSAVYVKPDGTFIVYTLSKKQDDDIIIDEEHFDSLTTAIDQEREAAFR